MLPLLIVAIVAITERHQFWLDLWDNLWGKFAVVVPILFGQYLKHRSDQSQYRQQRELAQIAILNANSARVAAVQTGEEIKQKLDNGITSKLEEIAANTKQEGC